MLLISHDLGSVGRIADRVAVMRAGRIVETGPAGRVLARRRPVPAPAAAAPPAGPPLLEVRGLVRTHRGRRGAAVRALDGVDLTVAPGEVVGLVGESGSGKSTLARILVCLDAPDAGSVVLDGVEAVGARGADLARIRRTVQIVFQDPYTSLDPRLSVGATVAEPLEVQGALARPALRAPRHRACSRRSAWWPRSRHGGRPSCRAASASGSPSRAPWRSIRACWCWTSRSRRWIPRAPLRSPGCSRSCARPRDLAYLLISHDLGAVRGLAQRVAVMEAGRIVEEGTTERVFRAPRHPRTAALLAAAQFFSAFP